MNKVILIGNVGKDPEIRATQSGDKIANLSLATSDRWKDKASGERKERTEWHRVVVFGAVAGVVESYVSKGDKLAVEGKIVTRKWTDQSGQERYSTEIVVDQFNGKIELLGSKDGERKERPAESEPAGTKGGGADNTDLDDDIPF